jgi:hypothetical protein
LCFCFFYSNVALAKTTTTDAYTAQPEDGAFIYDQNCPVGMSNAYIMSIDNGGGSQAITFGACYDTFAITYTINNLLKEQGISVDKIHYSWKYLNGCFNVTDPVTGQTFWCAENIEERLDEDFKPIGPYADQMDTLIVEVDITDANGNIIETRRYDYQTWYDWRVANTHSENEEYLDEAYWQVEEDFIQLYDHTSGVGSIYTPDSLGDAKFRVIAKDGGMWEGAYGPIVRDGQVWFTYRSNPCAQTALYDPSCDGYSEAYAEHEYNNNCSANATYDPSCPGYAEAYYENQCQADPLYDSGCSGYADAYYNQQCQADPLYDSGCPGYATAYFNQQCTASALYDAQCPGHFDAQCDANTLYDFQCTGYDQAYLEQQCLYNPQYDTSCNGYVEPVTETTPVAEGSGTGDAVVDNIIAAPQPVAQLMIMPQPPAPAPEPIVIEIIPIEIEVEPTEVEIIEAEVEAEIQAAVEIETVEETIDEPVEEPIDEPVEEEITEEQANEEETEEESSGDVEQSVDSNEGNDEGDESSDGDNGDEASEDTSGDTTEVKKPVVKKKAPLTAKQKQKAKEKKMKAIIKSRLAKLAETMGEAVTLADQQALQAQITALINYVPGFLQYGKQRIPGVDFYEPEDIYKDKKIPENNRGLLNGLASQILHEKMVDEQYK